jgi:hypothetical protein
VTGGGLFNPIRPTKGDDTMNSRPRIFMIIVLLSIICCFTIKGLTEDISAFNPKEKMSFQVRWAFIKAGEAVVELLPLEDFNGEKSYHILYTAKTTPFVDIFYKVRDRIESYTNADMTHSLLYKKKHQGKSKKDITVTFNWEKQEAQYSSLNEKMEPISIMPGTFDPLSVFFAFRLHELHINDEFSIPVTDGKKHVIGKAKVIKRETIRVLGTRYDTFLVEPELEHVGGVFEKSKDAKLQIWVTADDRRIPVRIKSKVIVGSFVAELTSYEKGFEDESNSGEV